jgi:hypothetical protein
MDSLSLVDFIDAVGGNILEFLAETARPADLNSGYDCRFSQTKMQTGIVA